MRLRSLQLRNYRCYRGQHEIPFPSGIVGLLGPNGAGKSSLIEALAWTFYGQVAARTTAEGLRTSGLPSAEPVHVSVEFELSGDLYRVTRTLKGKHLTVEATLSRGDQLLASGAKETTRALAGLLGLDWRSFYTTMFTRQKELDAFSSMGAAERKAMVERLLGIDRLNEVVSRIRADLRENRLRREERRASTTDEQGRYLADIYQARKEELRERQARLAERKADLQAGVEQAQAAKDAADRDWNVAQRTKDRYHELTQRCQEADAGVEQATQAIDTTKGRLAELATKERELTGLEPQLAELEQAQAELACQEQTREQATHRTRLEVDLARSKERQKAKLAELAAREQELVTKADPALQLERLAATKEALEKNTARLQQQLSDLQATMKALQEQLAQSRRHVNDIERLGTAGSCPTCERPLADHQPKLVAKYRRELEQGRLAEGEMVREVEALTGKVAACRKELAGLTRRKDQLDTLRTERARLQAQVEAIQNELTGLDEQREALATELAPLAGVSFDPPAHAMAKERVARLQKLEGTVEGLRRELARKAELKVELTRQQEGRTRVETKAKQQRTKLAQLDFDPTAYKAAEKSHAAAADKLRQAEVELAGHEASVVAVTKDLEEVAGELKRQRGLLARIKELEARGRYQGRLEQLFMAFRSHLIGRVAPSLSAYTSQLLTDLSQGRYTQVHIEPDTYEVHIYDGPEAYPLNRFSGGETDLVNLALRLAVSRLLAERAGTELNLVVLDEVFGSQDEQRRQAILAGLQNLHTSFDQIVLITHIEEVKDRVEHTLRVEELPEGGARVVQM